MSQLSEHLLACGSMEIIRAEEYKKICKILNIIDDDLRCDVCYSLCKDSSFLQFVKMSECGSSECINGMDYKYIASVLGLHDDVRCETCYNICNKSVLAQLVDRK